jgi:nitrite reductase/ring-hydroxylating ferredoxin subunit
MTEQDMHVATPLLALQNHWLLAASASELGDAPLARTLLGENLVLFRDSHGVACALEDRCLHRQVALSRGCVRDGAVACPYHGFRFDGTGACVHVPTALGEHKRPSKKLRSYPVCEQDQSIWVYVGTGEPTEAAPRWPEAMLRGYATHELITELNAPLLPVLDNFVDTAHTGFVHAGLFRSSPTRPVTARIELVSSGVRIETFGESDVSSLVGRLLVPEGETITHVDEVILPFMVRVDYTIGSSRHILTTSICTPETSTRTRVYTRISAYLPPISKIVAAALVPLTRKILAQDKVVLENQTAQLAGRAAHWDISVAADAPTLAVARAFTDYCTNKTRAQDKAREVSYLL